MAKIAGQWRGFVPGLVISCAFAGFVMAALGWLDRDLGTIGSDLLHGARRFLQVDEQRQASPPPAYDIYAHAAPSGTSGDSLLSVLDTPNNEERALANHADRGAMVGRPVVADGNRLTLNGVPLRLWGVDAPELLQRCSVPGQAMTCGEAAKQALAKFVAGHRIACYDKGRDGNGQVLAQCFLGNIDINGWLVRSGWAFAVRDRTLEYVSRESYAKMKQLGIWRDSSVEAPWEWRRRQ